MKYLITAAVLIGCLLLCCCEGGKDSSSVTDGTTAFSITDSESVPVTTGTVHPTDFGEETTSKKITEITAHSGTTNTSADADKADIAIGDASTAVTVNKLSEPETGATAAQAITEQLQHATKVSTTSDKQAGVNSDNILPDDGLTWSPLVPVN